LAVSLLALALLAAPYAVAQAQFQVVHSFGSAGDGGGLLASVIADGAGDLYSTAANGGAYDSGIVFRLSPNGSGNWTLSQLL